MDTDSDDDELEDCWESRWFGNLDQTGDGDFDQDGLTNLEEMLAQTDPTRAQLDPDDDPDQDGLSNAEEQDIGTDPENRDSDGDGVDDGVEIRRGTAPLDPDSYPTPSAPYAVRAVWGSTSPGLFNAVISWSHPGSRIDGYNAEGVEYFRLYRRKLFPDIDCDLQFDWKFINCETQARYELVSETLAENQSAVLDDLEDLSEVLDGWLFSLTAVNGHGQESEKSVEISIIPFRQSTVSVPAPEFPVIFVPGINGDANTWKGAAERLKAVLGWGEAGIDAGTGAAIIPDCIADKTECPALYRFTFQDPPGPTGAIAEQGRQIGELVNELSVSTGTEKVILVAHSQGGLATRAYLQFGQAETNRVDRLVTYGTPHSGSSLIDHLKLLDDSLRAMATVSVVSLHLPEAAALEAVRLGLRGVEKLLIDGLYTESSRDLEPDSIFMDQLSDFATYPLPDTSAGIAYVCLKGRLNLFTEAIQKAAALVPDFLPGAEEALAAAEKLHNSIGGTDIAVFADNQDLRNVENLPSGIRDDVKVHFRDPVLHTAICPACGEGDDYIGVLLGLGVPVLSISVHSPVELTVIDPLNRVLSPLTNSIPGATYSLGGGVEIPNPIAGEYQIVVEPAENAPSNATYSLEVTMDGVTTVLASDVALGDIPSGGYTTAVEADNIVPVGNAGLDRTVRVGNVVSLDGSSSVDPDNSPGNLAFSWSQVSGISVVLEGNETAKPTFLPQVEGIYVFSVSVFDGEAWSQPDTVTITVVNSAPVALNDVVATGEDVPLWIDVLSNDGDEDGHALWVSGTAGASVGTVSADGSGVTYTPAPDFNGTDSFTYMIDDGFGGSATATVTVTVIPVNDAPVAVDDAATTDEDVTVTVAVLANDRDVDGDGLSVNSVSNGSGGTVSTDGTSVSYMPAPGFNRTDSFTYTVEDGHGGEATATVTVTVNPAAHLPMFYLTLGGNGVLRGLGPNGTDLAYRDEDILHWNGLNYAMMFDGSAVGLAQTARISAFDIDAANSRILMSFALGQTIPGVGAVTGSDIVAFDRDSGTFSLLFDGSDVGLNGGMENLDAINLLPDGRLVVSTLGIAAVPSGKTLPLIVRSGDLLAFTPKSLGETTKGTWTLYFDGSAVGLNTIGEGVDTASIAPNGDLYLSTLGDFSVPGVSGQNEDVFVCTPSFQAGKPTCTFWLYFDGTAHGLGGENVKGFDLP